MKYLYLCNTFARLMLQNIVLTLEMRCQTIRKKCSVVLFGMFCRSDRNAFSSWQECAGVLTGMCWCSTWNVTAFSSAIGMIRYSIYSSTSLFLLAHEKCYFLKNRIFENYVITKWFQANADVSQIIIIKQFGHEMFLASEKTIWGMFLMLPYRTLTFLDFQWFREFSYLLKLVYTHHNTYILFCSDKFRQGMYLFRTMSVGSYTKGNRIIFSILQPLIYLWGGLLNDRCRKFIIEIIFASTIIGIHVHYFYFRAVQCVNNLLHQRGLPHSSWRYQNSIQTISEIKYQPFGLLYSVSKILIFNWNTINESFFRCSLFCIYEHIYI